MSIQDAFHEQFGVVTRDQALAYGLAAHQIDYKIKQREWVSEHPGVYRASAVRPTWESGLLAATLASRGVASHKCAAALWDLEVFATPAIEITIAEGRSPRLAGARIHRSRQWDLRNQATRRGIRCTGIERTILDCAGVVSLEVLERLAEAAIRKKLTTWLRLADCLSEHSRRGRNGCLKLRVLLQRRLGTKAIPLSDFSRRIVQLLERANVPTPVVEYRISDSQGRHLLQVDLAWPSLKKAWELDGLQWHFGREDVERDRRKRNAVVAEGWILQEILWSMYINDPAGLVRMAQKFLAQS